MIRTAILGAGRAAAAWCDAITASGLGQVVRVLARGEGADSLAVRYGARPARHADEIFGGPGGGGPGGDGVQAVVIASPTDTHAGYLRRAREAGLHVMVEMPVARDTAGLDGALSDAAALAAAGRAAAAFLPLRFAPEWTHLRDAAAAGRLGTIGVVRLQMLAPYRPGHGAWAADFARSGGAVLALLPHLLDFAAGAFGPITRLNAERAPTGPGGPGGPGDLSRDHVLAIGRFESGALLHLSAGWTEAPGAPTTTAYEVAGSAGLMDYDSRRAPRLTLTPVAGEAGAAYGGNPTDATPIRRAAVDFLRAAAGAPGHVLAAPLADGVAATRHALHLLD